jgi:hypothetical protein
MRKLAELVPDHVLRDRHRQILLPVMHHEPDPESVLQSAHAALTYGAAKRGKPGHRGKPSSAEWQQTKDHAPDKVRQDGARPRLRPDRRVRLERLAQVRERDKVRAYTPTPHNTVFAFRQQ